MVDSGVIFPRAEVASGLLPVGGSQLLFYGFLGRFRQVCSLNVLLNTNQGLLEGIEGGGVQHLLLHFGSVRAPGHQEQFLFLRRLGRSLTLVRVFEVEQSISTLAGACLLQVLQELVVLRVAITYIFNINLFFILDIKHYISMFFILFDLFICCFTNVRNRYTRSHFICAISVSPFTSQFH